jgi:adenylate cyclase
MRVALSGPGAEPEEAGAVGAGAALARRLRIRFFRAVASANLLGAAVVFAFLTFVVPLPEKVENNWPLLRLNLLVFAGYMLVTLPLGVLWGRSIADPIVSWLSEGRAPTARERERTLGFPLLGYRVMGSLWGGAALLFGILNAFSSPAFGAMQACTIALGGLTTCAVIVLWSERTLRDVLALALEGGVPKQPVGPGVGARMVLAWALGTGIPLFGLALLAAAVLLGAEVSAERLAATVLFLGGLGLSVGLLAMWIAGRSVADPVEEVRAALAEVEQGNLEAEAPVSEGNEVGLLAAGFNRMAAGLRERERLRDLFGRHVGEDVARRALDRGVELGGEVRHCAALFVDLVGSTELAATRPPAEVVALLNRFFGVVVEVVRAHGGWVNKFEGDAALCVFGAPEYQPNATSRALATARELRDRLREEVPEVQAGIGVAAGPAVAGNVGAAERFEYTVIGDPVNEAARLTELAKTSPAGVLASEAAVSASDPAEAKRWRFDDEVVLRGRTRPTRLASPDGGPDRDRRAAGPELDEATGETSET